MITQTSKMQAAQDDKSVKIILLIGPSGSGKTYLAQQLKARGIPELVSHTTRLPREGEIEGVSYYFVSQEEFENIPMIETVKYGGNLYGSSVKEVEEKSQEAKLVYVIADLHGLEQYRAQYGNQVYAVFIQTEPLEAIRNMMKRGDDPMSIYKRIEYMVNNNEYENKQFCDFVYINKQKLEVDSDEFYQTIMNSIKNHEGHLKD